MRIYVVDPSAGTQRKGALYRIDSAGRRTLLTDFGFQSHVPGVQREPLGKFPIGVAVEQDGTILVLDREAGGHGELFTVDSGSGSRAVLTDFGDATQGPKGKQPAGLAVAPDGTILVVDPRGGSRCSLGKGDTPSPCGEILTVDPVTGRRAVLTDFGDPAHGVVTTAMTRALAVSAAGDIYAATFAGGLFSSDAGSFLVRVDRATGQRFLVSKGFKHGALEALTVEAGGFVLAAQCCSELDRVNPLLGTVARIADLGLPPPGSFDAGFTFGSGDAIGIVRGSTSPLLADDTILATGSSQGSTDCCGPRGAGVYVIDPATGHAHLWSDFRDPAQGPAVLSPSPAGIAVAPGTTPPPPPAEPPPAGTVLVLDRDAGGPGYLLAVDPATGRRSVLAAFSDPAGGQIIAPYEIAAGPGGRIVATGISLTTPPTAPNDGLLLSIDPVTGQRTVLSDFANPAQGPTGFAPFGVAFDVDGSMLVTDKGFGGGSGTALWRVDPSTGTRTLVSDWASTAYGPRGRAPTGVGVAPGGVIYVADAEAGSDCQGFGDLCGQLFRVDRATGRRTLVSDFGNAGQGPLGSDPTGVAFASDGTVLVFDPVGLLFGVDAATGLRTLVSDYGNGAQGPTGGGSPSIVVRADGTILTGGCFGTNGAGAICRVDRATGTRTVFDDLGDPSLGFAGAQAVSMAIVP